MVVAATALRRLAAVRSLAVPLPAVVPAGLGLSHRCVAQPAESSTPAGLSTTANSYISLGAFETMGGDVGRMATGIAYLEETVQLQESEFAAEVDPRRRAARALSLAQSLLQVGRQHHQQQDPNQAIRHYQRALELVEETLAFREAQPQGAPKRAVEYARFVLSEICSSTGVAYNDVDRQEEALAALQRALTLRKETVGKSHPSVAECLNNLGALYFARGSLQKAAEHYEQALDLLVAAAEGRQEGAYVALTLYNIGVCRSGLGQMEASVTALKRALRIAEQALGSDHRQVELIRETLRKGPEAAKESHAQPGAQA
mmetsp:Transcript_86033/g.238331  ORF Transcript_86033/g.238331 Transcript_86033/m.238331 type:complete len:316 (-) Transcript_86033:190-1137(-)